MATTHTSPAGMGSTGDHAAEALVVHPDEQLIHHLFVREVVQAVRFFMVADSSGFGAI